MIYMPANSTGNFWSPLARETGRLGHLYSPGGERGPYPWFPHALDNGAWAFWKKKTNVFDHERWEKEGLCAWNGLLNWQMISPLPCLWAIVPDTPGDWNDTTRKWGLYARVVVDLGLRPAVAVQNGATRESVLALDPKPFALCIGGNDEFKAGWRDWIGVCEWTHYLACCSPALLHELEAAGLDSADGRGMAMGDFSQTYGLERWARKGNDPELAPWIKRTKGAVDQGDLFGSLPKRRRKQ